jgi:hypothetical protein
MTATSETAAERGLSTSLRQADGIRASDGERQAVVDRLHEALGEGRLDLDETDSRVAAAYAARYRSDLEPLLADLPSAAAVPGETPSWAAIWVSILQRARATLFRADGRGRALPLTVVAVALVVLGVLGGAAASMLDGMGPSPTAPGAVHLHHDRLHDVPPYQD